MAPKVPVSLTLVEEVMGLYRNTQLLIAHDHAITPEERMLADQFREVVKLAWRTNAARKLARAAGDGYDDTGHQARLRRELDQQLERFDTKHDRWISNLEPAKTRLVVPFGRHYSGFGESA